ncbi:ATP-dependent DNA helicase UvrD/PcrA [Metamycoplasma cloacale]|uniref:DNA 3'-5' helicase n=1 Tax=Metamycoplasma cloacale TaxID=92401 RepID=A0A2Z4LLA9_9BACT|nr:ATP-dependent helicase [Metamycoplasma cloacale]AWX42532.1 ATP-dependent DNA helicase [Metamycoplasma cloacale]VEU79122.1 ATP-dependent DNA helicase UvrD/PcrA [Metamycoplasma cloacale]VEU79808.1 ATP-dependent DNA helicase UvrD/PcrA [Metamycoplasma cloacale]
MNKLDLETLNTQQRAAILHTDGPLRIVAGAGSGKTRVLTHKIAYLIQEENISSRDILAVTFSNKAANEMKERVIGLLGNTEIGEINIYTFHSLCARILRKEIHNMNYPNDFQILDESDQKEVLKLVYNELDISATIYTYGSILSFIQNQKNDSKSPEDLLNDEDYKNDVRAKIYQAYQRHLDIAHSLDFDDLLVFVYRLFYDPKYEGISKKWENRFKYVLVDEFQDTSKLQYDIVKKLAYSKNLTIVGDPDQTIYSWRNADINLILNFDKDFENVKTIKLEQNYRSTGNILNVANKLIKHNKLRLQKELFTINENGENIEFFCGHSEEAEARWIANQISDLKRNRVQLKNIAILFRINSYSRAIEEALISENTIYKLFGSIKFYQREEIKVALAYLRVIYDGSEISLMKIINKPSRRIGDATIEKLLKFARANNVDLFSCLENRLNEIKQELNLPLETLKNIASLVNNIRWARKAIHTNKIHLTLKELMINKIQYFEEFKKNEEEYEEKMNNFSSLIKAIENWQTKKPNGTIDEYLQEITLILDRDVDDDAASYVSLMTVHNAKGLEFDYVFVAGLAENIFPLRRAISISPKIDFSFLANNKNIKQENQEGLEEERRLAYVAFTRAKTKLFLSFAIGKGGTIRSRFLSEAGIKKTNSIETASSFSISKNINENVNLIPGDFITHKTYGRGEVLEVVDNIIHVKFGDTKKVKTFDKYHPAIKKLIEDSNA